MKNHSFVVNIVFEDDISDHNEIKETAEKIANAIENEINKGQGIASDNSETFTKSFTVENAFENIVVKRNLMNE